MDHLLNIMKIQKFRETDNFKDLYNNELNKACFAHDAVYCHSKFLAKRTVLDMILKIEVVKLLELVHCSATKLLQTLS